MTAFFLILLLIQKSSSCPDDPYCQQCGENNVCIYCVYSYPDEKGTCVPTTTVPGCYAYSDINTCMVCDDGHYESVDKICYVLDQKIIQVCRFSYTSTLYCDVCYNFTRAINGTCTSDLRCTDLNCNACWISNIDGLEYCYECAGKYVIWANLTGLGVGCFRSGFLSGCYSGKTYNVCNNCNYGFFWQNGRCLVNRALLSTPIVVFNKGPICKIWVLQVFGLLFNFWVH